MELEGTCPYCGEPFSVWIDEGGGSRQRYIEDCAVCCRPIELHAVTDDEGEGSVEMHRLDD